jgi:hypothetical protein
MYADTWAIDAVLVGLAVYMIGLGIMAARC